MRLWVAEDGKLFTTYRTATVSQWTEAIFNHFNGKVVNIVMGAWFLVVQNENST